MDKIKCNTNFYREINEYNIHVPYYQRDYAQGRTDGGRIDNIRKVFVEDLIKAIKGEKICHLGLVFGSYDEYNKVFIAVDGQQRLTTVFLLHWYMAWRENKLSNYKNILEKFSWSTRNYSSQFTDLLFRILPSDNANVINTIKSHCDYFLIWENDPTVKGMLTMLEEIESQYPDNETNLCEKLFQNDYNIKYDILKLEKDSDGKTYLKMNSRGRSLTTFELFKSKFIDKYNPNFGSKFDNEWLNFMLERSKNEGQFGEPDFSFMNLINEYAYLQLRLNEDEKSENADNYKEFINAKITENLIDTPFISFEKYQNAFENKLGSFEKFFDWIIANYDKIKFVDDNIRFKDSRFFIDAIIRDNNPNFSHRVKLFALYKFAELSEYKPLDEMLYKRWSRVFRNLVANTDIEASYLGRICKTINKINVCNIYSYLSQGEELSSFDGRQTKEEVAKIKQILDENDCLRKYEGVHKKEDGSNYQTWEEIVNDAENYSFFKGAIRFLFQDEKGKVTDDSWRNFDTKWKNAKDRFLDNRNKDNVISLKNFIMTFSGDWNLLTKFGYNNQDASWRKILLNPELQKQTDEFLNNNLKNDFLSFISIYSDEKTKYLQEELIKSDILKEMTWDDFKLRWSYNHYLFMPNGAHAEWKKYIVATPRNQILTDLFGQGQISFEKENTEHRLNSSGYYWGWNIKFKYQDNWIHWNVNSSGKEELYIDGQYDNKIKIQDYFKITKDSIIENLNTLIKNMAC